VPTRVSKIEWMTAGAATALWIGSNTLPEGVAVAPEYVTFHNALLLIAVVAAFTIVVRQVWLRLRWWSIPIDVVLLGLMLLPIGLVLETFLSQLRPPSEEGFLYRGGLGLCSTHVAGTSLNRKSGQQLYVLQQYCVPDGPEKRTTYSRKGASPFMHRIDADLESP
jgi:hypothetical protein